MAHRPKCKTWSYKTPRRKHRSKSLWPWFGQDFLNITQSTIHEEKSISYTTSKLRTSPLWITLLREWKDKPQNETIFVNHICVKRIVFRIYKEL